MTSMMSMYSLYRAWLLRDTASIASPSLSLPPDLIISASAPPYQFIAHRTLVSSHSGYLKSAIAQGEEYGKSSQGSLPPLGAPLMSTSFGNHQGIVPGMAPSNAYTTLQGVLEVSLPSSIQADIFSPLLTFMYTGYLDLTLQNIYELLLAVNILQMPHALDLCRSYLLHNVHSVASLTFNSQHLAKPIPGRRDLPPLLAVQPTFEEPHSLAIDKSDLKQVKPQEVASSAKSLPNDMAPRPSITTLATVNSIKRLPKGRRRRRFPKPIEPLIQQLRAPSALDSDSSDDVTVVTTERAQPSCSLAESSRNTVVDIASCDGPVHFTRVLNENYDMYRNRPSVDEGIPQTTELARRETEEDSEVEINIDENSSEDGGGDENEENIARHLETEHSFQINFRHQIERQSRGAGETIGSELSEFKPSTADRLKALHHSSNVGVATRTNQRRVIPRTVLKPVVATAASQREVRLLDMNVQYYPCKTCGAKFPSYYFVHKHRRRVHPEEEGSALPPNQTDEVDHSTGN